MEPSAPYLVVSRQSNIVQAAPDRSAFLYVLIGAEAPPERTSPGTKNASSTTSQTTQG